MKGYSTKGEKIFLYATVGKLLISEIKGTHKTEQENLQPYKKNGMSEADIFIKEDM